MLVALSACLPTHPEMSGPVLNSLALGDSFTAGNSAMPGGADEGYMSKSPDDPRNPQDIRQKNDIPHGCFRNINNYIHQFASDFVQSKGATITAACTGDTILNVHDFAGGGFEPGQYIGFEAGDRAKINLITLTIGGNDLHFKDIVQQCYVGVSDHGTECRSLLQAAIATLQQGSSSQLYAQMKFALGRLTVQFPNAKVVLIGYPLINEDLSLSLCLVSGATCPSDQVYFPSSDLKTVLDLANQLQEWVINDLNNEVSEDVYGFLPLHKTDGSGFYDGHGIGSQTPWIRSPFDTLVIDEFYHPTYQGHTAIAGHLYAMPMVQELLDDVPQNL
jgi:hypothetical protein